jgi:hypothetical protein
MFCALTALVWMGGCGTLEQRWETFDAERRQEVGVKTKDYDFYREGALKDFQRDYWP